MGHRWEAGAVGAAGGQREGSRAAGQQGLKGKSTPAMPLDHLAVPGGCADVPASILGPRQLPHLSLSPLLSRSLLCNLFVTTLPRYLPEAPAQMKYYCVQSSRKRLLRCGAPDAVEDDKLMAYACPSDPPHRRTRKWVRLDASRTTSPPKTTATTTTTRRRRRRWQLYAQALAVTHLGPRRVGQSLTMP